MAAPRIRYGMASLRGPTTQRLMPKPFGRRPQVSRPRTCRRMPRSMGPERTTSRAGLQSVGRTDARLRQEKPGKGGEM
jgi:hypothetical protein